MSITIEMSGKELNSVASSVCRLAISGAKAHEVFGYVRLILIPSQGKTLGFLSGANGAQSLTRPITVQAGLLDEQKIFLMSGSKLQQIATAYKDARDKPVKLKIEEETLKGTFSAGRSKIKVELADPADYPALEKITGDTVTVTLPYKTFVTELARAKHAAAINSPRAFCNGVNLAFANGSMSVVSTDGHRMFKSVMGNITVEGSTQPSVIIPTIAIEHICGAGEVDDSPVVIKLNGKMAEFNCASAQIRTTLLDAEYPNVSSFFSAGKQPLGQVQRDEFMAVLSRIKPITNKASQLDVDFDNDEIVVRAIDEAGKILGEDALPYQSSMDGKKMRFSCSYLLDALTNVDGDTIQLELDADKQFLVCKPHGSDAQSAVVMPMAR